MIPSKLRILSYGINESNHVFYWYSPVIVWIWTFIRILAVLLLWLHLWWGFIFNIMLDIVDGDLFARIGIGRTWYQYWDKIIDFVFYIGLFLYAYQFLNNHIFFSLLTFFLLYRLVGLFLYIFTKKEYFLLVFVNLFTGLFIIMALFPNVRWSDLTSYYLLFIIWLGMELLKEWWIHVLKVDLTSKLFGFKRKW
jgi:hypothetical protein